MPSLKETGMREMKSEVNVLRNLMVYDIAVILPGNELNTRM